jgi:hypothetical protein
MYFNVSKKLINKYEKFYPDSLSEVAGEFSEFKESFKGNDEILLTFNEHLKLFSIVNSWRLELFFQWDVCRLSLINASAIVKEYCVNYKENDVSVERITNDFLAEYYLDNISFRVFSLLDKIGHPLNLMLNLNLPPRKVTYFNIKNNIANDWPEINKLFLEFENSDEILSDFKEYRNSLTHRNHLLQPKYELNDVEIDLGENNENGLNGKLKVNMLEMSKPEFSIIELYETTEEIYNRLTIFLEKLFLFLLNEIKKRYSDEVKFHLNEFIKNK